MERGDEVSTLSPHKLRSYSELVKKLITPYRLVRLPVWCPAWELRLILLA